MFEDDRGLVRTAHARLPPPARQLSAQKTCIWPPKQLRRQLAARQPEDHQRPWHYAKSLRRGSLTEGSEHDPRGQLPSVQRDLSHVQARKGNSNRPVLTAAQVDKS